MAGDRASSRFMCQDNADLDGTLQDNCTEGEKPFYEQSGTPGGPVPTPQSQAAEKA